MPIFPGGPRNETTFCSIGETLLTKRDFTSWNPKGAEPSGWLRSTPAERIGLPMEP